METNELEKLKYPIGKFSYPDKVKKSDVNKMIKEIDKLPKRLKDAIKNFTDEQLDTAYRPEGWTVRQVIHHVADSHVNSYTRFRLALTEENPTIKLYMEEKWAELPDAKSLPVKFSIDLLKNLHKRWVVLLKSMDKDQLKRTFYHPEKNKDIRLDQLIALYAWHSNHHLAHITELKNRMNWQ